MIIQLLKKIRLRYWVLFFGIICLGFIATHSIFIIESPIETQLSMSNDSTNQVYSGAKSKRHIKIVGSGRWYIAAKRDSQVTGTVQKSRPFMIPETVRLEPKPQRSTQKLSSVGNQCILYDNSSADATISSSCTQGSQTISKIIGDSTQQIISGAANITTSLPSSKGFMYVLSAPYGSSRYAIGEFDAAATKTITYFNGELSTVPQLVLDASTGFVTGAVLDQRYISQAELARGIKPTTKLLNSNDATVVKSNDTTLFTLNGTDSGRSEGEADDSTEYKSQIIRTYKKTTGKLLTEMPLNKGYYIRDFAVRPDGEIMLIGESVNTGRAVICYDLASLNCEEIWGSRDVPDALVVTKDLTLFVTDGSVWSYNQQLHQSELIYKEEGSFVTNIQTIDGRYYISTKIPNSVSDQPYSNYQLLLSKNFMGSKRLDSLLPTGKDDAFINQHRGFITGYSVNKSLSKSKIYNILIKEGVTASELSDFQIQLTTPIVRQPVERVVLGFPVEGE